MRKEILLGTSNPSKVEYFAHQLRDFDVKLLTLKDLGIEKLPDENGKGNRKKLYGYVSLSQISAAPFSAGIGV